MRAVLIGLTCLSFLPLDVEAAHGRIIVEAMANSTGDESLDPLSEGFSDLLVAYLSAYDGLEILYRDDLHEIWRELAQSASGLDRSDTLRIGALIQANRLVKGGFVKIDGKFRANVHVYSIETTELEHSFERVGDIGHVDTLAAALAKDIADELLNGADIRPPVAIDAQPVANTHFMKGLGYHYSGLYDHAVAEFMQVLDLDPARADARLWLGRSYDENGDHDHARIEYRRFLREFPDHADADRVQHALDALPSE